MCLACLWLRWCDTNSKGESSGCYERSEAGTILGFSAFDSRVTVPGSQEGLRQVPPFYPISQPFCFFSALFMGRGRGFARAKGTQFSYRNHPGSRNFRVRHNTGTALRPSACKVQLAEQILSVTDAMELLLFGAQTWSNRLLQFIHFAGSRVSELCGLCPTGYTKTE